MAREGVKGFMFAYAPFGGVVNAEVCAGHRDAGQLSQHR
jgi:hypothetical protein